MIPAKIKAMEIRSFTEMLSFRMNNERATVRAGAAPPIIGDTTDAGANEKAIKIVMV